MKTTALGSACFLLLVLVPGAAEPGDPLMEAPFAAQRANFLHAALGIPRLESAEVLEPTEWYVRLRTDHSSNKSGPKMRGSFMQHEIREGRRVEDSFLGLYHTWVAVEASRGWRWDMELALRAGISGWDEHNDHFYFFSPEGTPVVSGEHSDVYATSPTSRDDDIADVVLQLKKRLVRRRTGIARCTVSTAAAVKLPLGAPNNLVDAGTTDVCLRLLGSATLGPAAVHVNVGPIVPLGSQNLFVPEVDVELDPMLAWGAGVVWMPVGSFSLGAQVEGNTGAMADIGFLSGNPATVLAGIRKRAWGYLFESGVGLGLGTDSAYGWSAFAAVGRRL